ncbi:hypothetical protein JR316_0008872 [Psilocybe cubensis]|uniref:Uncharacterized protein n=1 Tax=Psilocybe cubensis TaxID=181762 RepID=A0ACB8GSL2_PSICU|nr:hypothetical protein JR316_0008872 [Psilocybe cubensis]KAH9478417.1 hypothetical protein JR316_0008872 [Psilocybe cubensis]
MPHYLMSPVNLQNLPIEITCHIFSCLEMHDLLACSQVTKHLRRIIANSSQLQYAIELGRYRMVPLLPASVGPSFSTRLSLLRDRERAWKYMNWKKKYTLKLPPTGSIYEFVGGLYGNGREDDSRTTASISFLELPTADITGMNKSPDELQMWTHPMGDITIVDFTMDPSQDLLVLVALAPSESKYLYELHLRSIKTNQPHPKAPVSVLSCLRKPSTHTQTSDVIAAVRVQVAGNLLALLIKESFEGDSAHLEIWDWESNPHYSCSMGRSDGIDDFTFLTRDSFLLVLPPGQFEVYTFRHNSSSTTSPILRAAYLFPPLSEGYMYWYISMSSNPAPGYVPYSPSDTPSKSTIPGHGKQIYYPRPDERIHACCLYIFNPSREEAHQVHSFVFFVNLRMFIDQLPALAKIPTPPRLFPRYPSPVATAKRPADTLNGVGSEPSVRSPGSSTAANGPSSPRSDPTTEGMDDELMRQSLFLSLSSRLPTPIDSSHIPQYPPFPKFDPLNAWPSTPSSKSSDRTQPPLPPAIRYETRRSGSPDASPTTVAIFPWETWGPHGTRWFEECISTDWQHAVYGLRTVESIDPEKNSQQTRISLVSANNYVSVATQTTPTLSASSSASSSPNSHHSHAMQSGVSNGTTSLQHQNNVDSPEGGQPKEKLKYLRIRDFNPYSFPKAADPMTFRVTDGKGKQKAEEKTRWRVPRLVVEPSTTPVKGVFKQDIVSSLPYMEVVSEEAFEVTDVMMDDCRLLLLKRGDAGKLKKVDVLMM